jgi:glutathione S-transferase
MLKLYHAPRTRALRVLWLLEELELPFELVTVPFTAPARDFFSQQTPLGKIPTLEDEDEGVVMCESGAILQYILERHGNGRLEPAHGDPARAAYLQWLHFAEATAYPPIGILVWLTRYRDDASEHVALFDDVRHRAASGLGFVERAIGDGPWLLGDAFTAADVMMGFTLLAARLLGLLDERYPRLHGYLARLEARPALQRALAHELLPKPVAGPVSAPARRATATKDDTRRRRR